MRGYFSNIAKQSGLRFSRQAGSTHRVGEKATKALSDAASPIETEEIVMVPPSVERPGVETKSAAKHSLSERLKPQRVAPEIKVEKQVGKVTEPEFIPRLPADVAASEIPPKSAPVEPKSNQPNRQKPTGVKKKPVVEPLAQADIATTQPAIERTVFVDQPANTSDMVVRPSEPDKKVPAVPETVDKGYFSQTAEIIDGRVAPQEEVHSVLIHEIQEWVAAGPTPDVQTLKTLVHTPPEAVETQEVVRPVDGEPGIIRIAEQRRTEAAVQESQHRSMEIEEHSLDLSIGTISVVIEGDEKPQAAPAPQRESRPAEHAADTRFSRLRRSYL